MWEGKEAEGRGGELSIGEGRKEERGSGRDWKGKQGGGGERRGGRKTWGGEEGGGGEKQIGEAGVQRGGRGCRKVGTGRY